jgi:hypothetical protein
VTIFCKYSLTPTSFAESMYKVAESRATIEYEMTTGLYSMSDPRILYNPTHVRKFDTRKTYKQFGQEQLQRGSLRFFPSFFFGDFRAFRQMTVPYTCLQETSLVAHLG